MPRFIITSRADATTLDLCLDNGAGVLAVLDSYTFKSDSTIFALRVEMHIMWLKYCFTMQSENEPCPPLPPVQWNHSA